MLKLSKQAIFDELAFDERSLTTVFIGRYLDDILISTRLLRANVNGQVLTVKKILTVVTVTDG